MIVRHIDEVKGTKSEVKAENWTSFRFLLARDGMGYSMHETHIHPNTETRMCYRNHLEAVYCVGGAGEIEEIANGNTHPIRPGTLYALNEHDDHKLRAGPEGLRLICVFNPPVTGEETHDKTGAYPAPAEMKAAS
ncbi:MAG: ectoine synthase [Gammaproteobacteria bacterium]